jgi:hypothetical protein
MVGCSLPGRTSEGLSVSRFRSLSTLLLMIALVGTSTSYLACSSPARQFGEGGNEPSGTGGSKGPGGGNGGNGGDGPSSNR